LSGRVGTALEREISGTGTDPEPIVVDVASSSSMSVARPDDEDEATDEDGVYPHTGIIRIARKRRED